MSEVTSTLSPETTLGGVILIALMLYALLGGADFGGGFWDLTAWGPRRAAQRELISRALAPVWEVNHIWLVLAWVLLFSVFPRAFSMLGSSLHVPLTLFLLGIVGRGSAFAFRSFDLRGDGVGQRWGLLFSLSSLLAPLLLGEMVGVIASGQLNASIGVFPVLTALFALALFCFLAAVYLCVEASTHGSPELAEDFRTRALGSGAWVGVLAGAVLLSAHHEATWVFHGLWRSPWAAALQVATGVCAVAAFALLRARRYPAARLAAIAQVSLIVLGWGAAQYPYLIVSSMTLAESSSHLGTQRGVLWVLAGGALVLIPSLLLLFRVFKRLPARPVA